MLTAVSQNGYLLRLGSEEVRIDRSFMACTLFQGQKMVDERTQLVLASQKRCDFLDNRQITHLICVRLKHLLYDFFWGVLGLFPVVFLYKRPKATP